MYGYTNNSPVAVQQSMDLLGSVIAANPCPPMPLQCTRLDPANGKPIVGYLNTHHILMQAYAHAMQRDNQKENTERKNTQEILTQSLLTSFTEATTSQDPEKLYMACSTFTRSYIHAFMPKRPMLDARFAPYDEVCKDTYEKNPVVHAACEHLAGMIFYDEHNGTSEKRPYAEVLESLKCEPFSSVLCKYADVHNRRMKEGATLIEIEDE
jgi:hypothetical protein